MPSLNLIKTSGKTISEIAYEVGFLLHPISQNALKTCLEYCQASSEKTNNNGQEQFLQISLILNLFSS